MLFADIRGFTGLTQRLEPEVAMELLNSYYHAIGEAIFAEQGSINNMQGDGLMAVFGVPQRRDDHAGAAVSAACRMREAVRQLSPRWKEIAGTPLQTVIAVNSGEVLVGSIGDPRHLQFTVIGDVVNVAARLETEAKQLGVEILITDPVRRAMPPDVRTRDLGENPDSGEGGHRSGLRGTGLSLRG